jgi:hypothetical protein
MKMELTDCSEMLAFKLQTPGNNPEKSIRHSKQGESLKSRKPFFLMRGFIIRQAQHPCYCHCCLW